MLDMVERQTTEKVWITLQTKACLYDRKVEKGRICRQDTW